MIELKAKKNFIFDEKKDVYIIQLEEKKSFFSFFNKEDLRDKVIETEAPKEGCRAFITDLVVGDEFLPNHISEIYKLDDYSDYVGAGKYNNCRIAFPKAASGTFDGIAIDQGTRIVIYSKPNFVGKKLLDIEGPAIINNVFWKKDNRYNIYMRKKFKEPYQNLFPQKVRFWSKTNMHSWTDGSIIVSCV